MTAPGATDAAVTSLPDLLYSDTEQALRSSVRKLCTTRSSWHDVLERTEFEQTTDHRLWLALGSELGVLSLPVPEQLGGAGAGWRETAVVAEELGRHVAAVPYLGSAVMATAILLAAGADDLVRELATGASTAALAVNFAGSKVPADPPATLSAGMLHGAVRSVADALIADVLLVPTKSGQLACVATSDPAVIIEPVVSFDMTRPLADIAINGAPAEVIADGEQAEIALRAAFNIGGAMLASEQLGVAEWCLQSTVDYLIQRRQFGRLLGSYQALKHRCADMWVEVSQARAVARYAAACAATEDVDLPIAAALAQAYCSEVAVRAAELCVQLHGGIGFTWEFPAHLYLKRARSSAVALGTADVHRTRLAALLDLPSQSHALADLSRDSKEST